MVNHSHPTALFHAPQPCPLRLLFKIYLFRKVFVIFFTNEYLVKVGNSIHKNVAVFLKQFNFFPFVPCVFNKKPYTAFLSKLRAKNSILIIVPPVHRLSFWKTIGEGFVCLFLQVCHKRQKYNFLSNTQKANFYEKI